MESYCIIVFKKYKLFNLVRFYSTAIKYIANTIITNFIIKRMLF